MNVPTPTVEYGLLSPMLIVFGVAIAGVLVEAFVSRQRRYGAQLVLSFGGLVAALVAVGMLTGQSSAAVMGAVAVDGPTLFLQATILSIGIVAVAFIAARRLGAFVAHASTVPGGSAELQASRAGIVQTEVFPLTMLAVGGMLLFPASNDLLTMFIALEVLSLPLYLLCGLARHRRLLSQEAALKYFLLGAFSSAFFLYGVALLYGYAGTLSVPGIGEAIEKGSGDEPIALTGVALLIVGVLFKVGAVPFHAWIPDVYQGAPTPITGFMAAATKVAAFGALLRILYVALPGLIAGIRPVLWAVAILTMLIAAVLTVTQTDIKRLIAYSSVANAGFILTGVTAIESGGLPATMFYLVAYAFSTLGAFAVVSLIRNQDGDEETDIARWAGLGHRSPVVSTMLALFLLALAGIPLTSGFVSKFAVFQAALAGGATVLVLVGVLSSAIAAFAYARVIITMFSAQPNHDTPRGTAPGALIAGVVGVSATVTVLLGIVPQPVLDLTTEAGQFMR